MRLSNRAANAVYWVLGLMAMVVSVVIIHARRDDDVLFLVLVAAVPLCAALLAFRLFPDDL